MIIHSSDRDDMAIDAAASPAAKREEQKQSMNKKRHCEVTRRMNNEERDMAAKRARMKR